MVVAEQCGFRGAGILLGYILALWGSRVKEHSELLILMLSAIADHRWQRSLARGLLSQLRPWLWSHTHVTSYLETNPRIGRMVPEMRRQDKIREIILGNYRIIYKITDPKSVHILTVHHSYKRLRQTSLRRLK